MYIKNNKVVKKTSISVVETYTNQQSQQPAMSNTNQGSPRQEE